jgi:hypothetical protein
MKVWSALLTTPTTVFARLDRATQYSEAPEMEP